MASRKETSSDHQRTEYGDQRIERGAGGEIHQVASGDAPRLTTQQGIVVSDDQNTLRADERGPGVLEDFHFREKIFHFDHERIPERVVHARGYGAHGYFENYEPLTEITRADPFSEADLRTPVFVGSPPWRGTRAPLTWPGTCAASRRSFTPGKATGI